MLAAPALTRLYHAEDFGYLQLYMSCMAFAVVAVSLRCEQAILLPEREEVAANMAAVSFCAVALVSAVLAIAVWWIHHAHFFPANLSRMQNYLWLLPVGACGAGIYQTLSFWALRQKAYKRVATTKFTQVASMLGTQTAFGLFRPGPLGLLLGDAIGRMNGSVTLARLSFRTSWQIFRQVRWSSMWAAAVRYKHFPLISTASALVSAAGIALPVLLIGQLYGPQSLGWFALGDRILGAPALLIGAAVSQVYSVEAAGLSTSDPSAMHVLFVKLAKRLLLLALVPFVIVVSFGPGLFALIFGEPWREAGAYARLLSGMYLIAFVVWPLMPTMNILEKQGLQFAWDAGRLTLTLSSLWIVHHYGYSARAAVGAFAAAMLVAYLIHFFLVEWAIRNRIMNRSASSSPKEYAELSDVANV